MGSPGIEFLIPGDLYLVVFGMDDLFKELEAKLSRVGARTVWKRQIGPHTIWLAPITLLGQEKVSELINSPEMNGPNILNETKRVTLSHSIVGIDDLDLTRYRNGDNFITIQGIDGRPTNVFLEKYLYDKLLHWGAQYLDDIFSVYADCLESHSRENLQQVKFENARTPVDELEELERKAGEIRASLGKPPLVEAPRESGPTPFSPFQPVEKK